MGKRTGRVVYDKTILVRVGKDHPLSDGRGYAAERRIVMSEKLGRWLLREEYVRNIDRDKHNNHPDNLEIIVKKKSYYKKRPRNPSSDEEIVFGLIGKGVTKRLDIISASGKPERNIYNALKVLCRKDKIYRHRQGIYKIGSEKDRKYPWEET